MPSRFRTVLLDLDGTLIDHFAAIHRCHAHAMTRLGLPAPTPAQVRAAVGGGLENAIRQLAGPEHIAFVLPLFRAHMEATMLDDVAALPGARELLVALRVAGTRTAVLTNKHGPAARRICSHLGLALLLGAVVGAGDTAWLKPDPRLTAHALALVGAAATCPEPAGGEPVEPAKRALLVGDSPYDIQTAHQAGLPCWCVTTGTHTAEQLRAAGADEIFPNLSGVMAALAG